MEKILVCTFILIARIGFAETTDMRVDKMQNKIYQLLDTDLDSAALLSQRSLEISIQSGYKWGEGNALFLKGYISKLQNEPGSSMIYYLRAIAVLEDIKSNESITMEIKIITNCGNILSDHFKYKEAIDYYSHAYIMAERFNLMKRMQLALFNRSYAYQKAGSFEEAMVDAMTSLRLAETLKDEYLIISSLNLIGSVFVEVGDYNQAIQYYQQIVDFGYQNLDPNEYKGLAFHNIANCFSLEQQFERAETFFLKALDIKNQSVNSESLFITYMDLADLYLTTGKLKKALEMGVAADQLYTSVKHVPENYKIYEILRNIYHQTGQYEQEDQYARLFQAENERFLEEQQHVMELRERFTMDLVLAGFNQETTSHQTISKQNYWIWALALLVLSVLVFYQAKGYWLRYSLSRQLRNIQDNSEV